MIPPTSIDGTDITGATIDGTDVTEITVDGDVVFSAGPTIVDDFETGNLSRWNTNGHKANINAWNITTTNVVQGSFALIGNTSNNENIYIDRSVSQNTPSFGNAHQFFVRASAGNVDNWMGWLSDKNEANFDVPRGHLFAWGDRRFLISTSTSNDIFVNHSPFANPNTNEWYRVKISYPNNNTLQAEVFELNGNLFASNSISILNQGFGNSVFLHCRDNGIPRFDNWTLL